MGIACASLVGGPSVSLQTSGVSAVRRIFGTNRCHGSYKTSIRCLDNVLLEILTIGTSNVVRFLDAPHRHHIRMQMSDRPAIDTLLLRTGIRLVHCLQKERGLSCAYYANNHFFEVGMVEARAASDAAAALIRYNDDVPVVSTLAKIRYMISTHRNSEESDDKFALHRIFVCFNTLISHVKDRYILTVIAGGTDYQLLKSPSPNRLRRSLSFDINSRLALTTNLGQEMEDNQKDIRSPSKQPSNATETKSLNNKLDVKTTNEGFRADGPAPLFPPSSLETRHVTFEAGKPKAHQLLALLHVFVRLKESAGVERAILSSLLAFRGSDDPSLELLVNDLILQVENQRSLIGQLEDLPEDTPKDLVVELATLSPALQDLQMIILADFESLKHAQYDVENIWDLISLYINKLHSVELFLIEELEYCLPVKKMGTVLSSTSLSTIVVPHATTKKPSEDENVSAAAWLQLIFPTDGDSVASSLQSMSPELIKQRILEALYTGDAGVSCDRVKDGVDSYFSRTAGLKQDMTRYLDTTVSTSTPATIRANTWEISIYELKFTKRIGVGAAATTYLADWSGQEVAVKVASTSRFGLEGWRTEVDALKKLHHPNIIRLMGSVYHESPLTYCLVLEYCNAGDLSTVLKYPTPKNLFFTVALGIANAMHYLHARSIIHRDLKPANVLCDGNVTSGNFTVKVTDFGVATQVKSSSQSMMDSQKGLLSDESARNLTGETGTYRWMASEVIRHEDYTFSVDVYSFAIILWQLLTREEPFMDVESAEAARLVAREMRRPPMPPEVPAALEEMIKANWDDTPGSRWPFERICTDLRKMQNSLTLKEKEYLESAHGHPVYEHEELNIKPEMVDKSAKKETKASMVHRPSRLSTFFGQKHTGKK